MMLLNKKFVPFIYRILSKKIIVNQGNVVINIVGLTMMQRITSLTDVFAQELCGRMICPNRKPDRINERGNHLFDRFVSGDRYKYDFDLCKPRDGWIQYDTEQDAWYFGVWVNVSKHLIVTYAEGDETICYCHDTEGLKAELMVMADFYGPPPPMAIGIDNNGVVTKYFDKDARPEV